MKLKPYPKYIMKATYFELIFALNNEALKHKKTTTKNNNPTTNDYIAHHTDKSGRKRWSGQGYVRMTCPSNK